MNEEKKWSLALDELEDAIVEIAERNRLSTYETGLLLVLFTHSTLHVLISDFEAKQETKNHERSSHRGE